MLTERTFDTGQLTISYVEGPPSGPPVVLLHGGGDRWQDFLPIIPYLVMRWHVFALDLRGHGKSGRVAGHQYRPDHYALDVIAFLKRELTEPVVLFGHSLGAWAALMAAAEEPEKVRGLILGDSPPSMERFVTDTSREETIRFWRTIRDLAASGHSVPQLASELAVLTGSETERDPSIRAYAKKLSQVDPDAAHYHVEGRLDDYVAEFDVDAAYRRLTCPVLLLQADPSHGAQMLDEDVDHALSLLTDGLHVRLEGVGHGLGFYSWQV
ncbi:MAG: alpha/beta fold hydrolase, partial [Anaerolineae bacterium]